MDPHGLEAKGRTTYHVFKGLGSLAAADFSILPQVSEAQMCAGARQGT